MYDWERAIPLARQIVLEVNLLMDDSRLLDSVRDRLLKGVVRMEPGGHVYTFRFDPEKGRHRKGRRYAISGGWLYKLDRFSSEGHVELEELRPALVLEALMEHHRMEIVRKVMAS